MLPSLTLASAVCLLLTTPLAHADPDHKLTAAQWRQDLQVLSVQLPLHHKSAFHSMTRAQFNSAVHQLYVDIPKLTDDQIAMRIVKIGVMMGDGHSSVQLAGADGSKTHFPARFARYPEGIFLRAAAPELASAVGGKVVKVGDTPIEEAMRRIDEVSEVEPGNDGHRRVWGPIWDLSDPIYLHGLGLSKSRESADFVLEKDGKAITVTMHPSIPKFDFFFDFGHPEWVDAMPPPVPKPLWMQSGRASFSFIPVPEHKAVYVPFTLVLQQDETLAAFTKRLFDYVDTHDVDRMVLDLRLNTGGDNTLLRPLVVSLIRSKLNKRGSLIVLIGPRTFSAAQNFVNRIENYTECIFMGEPTGQNVNFYGDPVHFDLPNSGMSVYTSGLWWQDKDPRDLRTATLPEVAVDPMTFKEYLAGQDRAVDMALSMPTPPTLEEWMEPSLARGVSAVLQRAQDYIQDPTHRYVNNVETRLNSLGYSLMSAKQLPQALAVFEANTRLYPKSSNTFDSLGDGYAAAGSNAEAIKAYQHCVELNPSSPGTKEKLAKLKRP